MDWKYDNYLIAAQVYHGTRPVGHPLLTQPSEISQSLYSRILFNCWLDLEDVLINTLAREARLVLVIYGRKLQNDEDKDSSSAPQYKQEELGWASVQLFDYKGIMTQGGMLLSIWPKECNYIYGPAPTPGSHPFSDHAVLAVEIAAPKVAFPPTNSFITSKEFITKGNFNSLDSQTQEQLLEISAQDMLCRLPPDIREVLWEKRHYLYKIPEALPKVLLAAHSWAPACLKDLYGMLYSWKQLSPVQAIQLLLPTFPDIEVRKLAVRWLHGIRTDELVDFLPQLVVALRHETYENNALAHFLLDRSLRSPRIAHHLFWLLSHTLPGSTPQNGNLTIEPDGIGDARYFRRMLLMLRSLFAICGEALRSCFFSQQILVKVGYSY
ncbi:phosphatidylinositol 4-phosphate 3-kinase C2 domain-containing subunit beta-like [Agrilus planipennis]|uniref:Phosphatidylinositol 4-phosphate 3-kinase C2 domain-containing subunit beta-like n=1 Tax=Agrilus planipennis TaxID=224129 RepID=A0A7F5REA9_AGRPL|nr:phosphatidylinositol 4-phosphate 3-kinase C2 domain-containing subunit beta-like [Agrilus planipennis]